ncbi:MAG: NADH-quinone oxidoreductase subunit NuoH [Coriobacteriia bacterium]|nr:NADH-quinone oxidoreductase subunit NuoH [Coriobacteriia bacterium]
MNPWLVGVLRFLAAIGLMLLNGVVLIYMLRKVLAKLHIRMGPMDNGPHGLLQTVFDVLKLLTKEDPTPRAVDKLLFFLAPAIVFVPSLMSYAVLPFSRTWVILDLPYGLLFIFAVMSIIPLGILAAGWSSNNKWSLIGAMRSVGSQVTYEVPMLLAALPVVMMANSMSLGDIVNAQSGLAFGFIPKWFAWNVPALVLFFIAGLIEAGQTPFDLAEAESELVAGFATEYSAMKFGLLFLSEFSNVFVFSALVVTLFFGGWNIPWVPADLIQPIAPVVFIIKTYLVIFLVFAIRGTLPRLRVDQFLATGWKVLLPASLAWVMVTGAALKILATLGGGQ